MSLQLKEVNVNTLSRPQQEKKPMTWKESMQQAKQLALKQRQQQQQHEQKQQEKSAETKNDNSSDNNNNEQTIKFSQAQRSTSSPPLPSVATVTYISPPRHPSLHRPLPNNTQNVNNNVNTNTSMSTTSSNVNKAANTQLTTTINNNNRPCAQDNKECIESMINEGNQHNKLEVENKNYNTSSIQNENNNDGATHPENYTSSSSFAARVEHDKIEHANKDQLACHQEQQQEQQWSPDDCMCETCTYYRMWYASHVNQGQNYNNEDSMNSNNNNNNNNINSKKCNQVAEGNNNNNITTVNNSSPLLHNKDSITEEQWINSMPTGENNNNINNYCNECYKPQQSNAMTSKSQIGPYGYKSNTKNTMQMNERVTVNKPKFLNDPYKYDLNEIQNENENKNYNNMQQYEEQQSKPRLSSLPSQPTRMNHPHYPSEQSMPHEVECYSQNVEYVQEGQQRLFNNANYTNSQPSKYNNTNQQGVMNEGQHVNEYDWNTYHANAIKFNTSKPNAAYPLSERPVRTSSLYAHTPYSLTSMIEEPQHVLPHTLLETERDVLRTIDTVPLLSLTSRNNKSDTNIHSNNENYNNTNTAANNKRMVRFTPDPCNNIANNANHPSTLPFSSSIPNANYNPLLMHKQEMTIPSLPTNEPWETMTDELYQEDNNNDNNNDNIHDNEANEKNIRIFDEAVAKTMKMLSEGKYYNYKNSMNSNVMYGNKNKVYNSQNNENYPNEAIPYHYINNRNTNHYSNNDKMEYINSEEVEVNTEENDKMASPFMSQFTRPSSRAPVNSTNNNNNNFPMKERIRVTASSIHNTPYPIPSNITMTDVPVTHSISSMPTPKFNINTINNTNTVTLPITTTSTTTTTNTNNNSSSTRGPRVHFNGNTDLPRLLHLLRNNAVTMACTAIGKAQLQAALRHQSCVAAILEVCIPFFVQEMEKMALDVHACHVMRAVVEVCSPSQTESIVQAFDEALILNMCTVSQYTRRIMQSLFERQLIDLNPILHILSRNAAYLAATQQGCIALMKVFQTCNNSQKSALIMPLIPTFPHIALDPLGNYVVQCTLEYSERNIAAQIIVNCFHDQLLRMSCDKYASNVVEKIIRCCGNVPVVHRMLLDELIYNPASLQEVACDGFGNFVLQSLIDSLIHPIEIKKVCDRLKSVLLNTPYAAKIEAKLKVKRALLTPAADHNPPQPLTFSLNNNSNVMSFNNNISNNNITAFTNYCSNDNRNASNSATQMMPRSHMYSANAENIPLSDERINFNNYRMVNNRSCNMSSSSSNNNNKNNNYVLYNNNNNNNNNNMSNAEQTVQYDHQQQCFENEENAKVEVQSKIK